MAFVYRKQNNQTQTRAKTPGPGQYNLQQQPSQNTAPGYFGRSPRQVWQASTTPGPGQYNVDKPVCEGQKILYQTKNSDFCVTSDFFNQGHGASSNFKSKSRRLTNNQNKNPGPGQYNLNQPQQKNSKQVYSNQKPTKLTRYLYEQIKRNGNQPGKIQECEFSAYGTGQFGCRTKQLEQKQNNGDNNESTKYNYRSIFNSRVDRKPLSRPQTSTGVGPGSYNIVESFNAIDRKTQALSVKKDHQTIQPKIDSQKNKIGPGYYTLDCSSFQRPKTSYRRGIACFGSTQTRFDNTQSHKSKYTVPGPQSYFHSAQTIKADDKDQLQQKKPAFNSSNAQGHQLPVRTCSTYFTQVSPCSYNPRNDFRELLKKNYIKGSIGNFGSNVQRFKESTPQEQKMEEKSIFSIKCGNIYMSRQKKKPQVRSAQIKTSLSIRHTEGPHRFVHLQNEQPLCYDSQSGTIGHKYAQKEQKDAPFLVCSERFSNPSCGPAQGLFESVNHQQPLNLIPKNSKPRKAQLKKGKMKSINNVVIGKFVQTAAKMSKIESMFNQIKAEPSVPLGPQTYDPHPMPKKKTHNVLFKNE